MNVLHIHGISKVELGRIEDMPSGYTLDVICNHHDATATLATLHSGNRNVLNEFLGDADYVSRLEKHNDWLKQRLKQRMKRVVELEREKFDRPSFSRKELDMLQHSVSTSLAYYDQEVEASEQEYFNQSAAVCASLLRRIRKINETLNT